MASNHRNWRSGHRTPVSTFSPRDSSYMPSAFEFDVTLNFVTKRISKDGGEIILLGRSFLQGFNDRRDAIAFALQGQSRLGSDETIYISSTSDRKCIYFVSSHLNGYPGDGVPSRSRGHI